MGPASNRHPKDQDVERSRFEIGPSDQRAGGTRENPEGDFGSISSENASVHRLGRDWTKKNGGGRNDVPRLPPQHNAPVSGRQLRPILGLKSGAGIAVVVVSDRRATNPGGPTSSRVAGATSGTANSTNAAGIDPRAILGADLQC